MASQYKRDRAAWTAQAQQWTLAYAKPGDSRSAEARRLAEPGQGASPSHETRGPAAAASGGPPLSGVSHPGVDPQALGALVGMGFGEAPAAAALRSCGGSLVRAAEMLLAG